jgi:hypothetical protein
MILPQHLVSILEMVVLSSMAFIRKLFCWLQNAVLLHVIYIHYFGGFRYLTSLARVLPFQLGFPFVHLTCMVNTLFHNTLLNVFTLPYLRPKHFKPSIPDQILCFYVNGLISANKHFSWKSCPKLLRRRSSLHYGYCWFGTAAFCTTYRKHAKFSPGSWKSVCGYIMGLFIM